MKKALLIIGLILVAGCKADIGDDCTYDIDCSPDGDRTCDNNQPGGYCLIITCSPDQCPEEAACVEFVTPTPEFSEDQAESQALYAQLEPNRVRTYCLKRCLTDKPCRGAYHCAKGDELQVELSGAIIDSKKSDRGVCVPNQSEQTDTPTDSESDTYTDPSD